MKFVCIRGWFYIVCVWAGKPEKTTLVDECFLLSLWYSSVFVWPVSWAKTEIKEKVKRTWKKVKENVNKGGEGPGGGGVLGCEIRR